jgi:hypothetical protein
MEALAAAVPLHWQVLPWQLQGSRPFSVGLSQEHGHADHAHRVPYAHLRSEAVTLVVFPFGTTGGRDPLIRIITHMPCHECGACSRHRQPGWERTQMRGTMPAVIPRLPSRHSARSVCVMEIVLALL